jgi:hypothetical protein
LFINIPNKLSCYIILITACGVMYCLSARAEQILPPTGGLPFGAVNGEINKDHLLIGPIVIGKDTVHSLFSKFGKSPIAMGDGGSPALICYISNKSFDPMTVVFEAWGRDADSELIGFTLMAEKNDKTIKSGSVSAKCTPSSLVSNMLQTASGIGVGLDVVALKKILGQPLHQSQDKIYFAYSRKVPVPVDEQATLPKTRSGGTPMYDILSTIEISMKNGRAVSVEIRKTETY